MQDAQKIFRLTCYYSEINLRSNYKSICRQNLFQNRTKIITNRIKYVYFGIFNFTGETTFSTDKIIIEKIYKFYFRSKTLRSIRNFLQNFCSVKIFSRTAIHNNNLHKNLLHFLLPFANRRNICFICKISQNFNFIVWKFYIIFWNFVGAFQFLQIMIENANFFYFSDFNQWRQYRSPLFQQNFHTFRQFAE